MLTYLSIYIYASLITIMDTINSKKYIQNILTIAFIAILIIISGTRYYLGGTDYYVYKNVFDSIPKLNEFFINYEVLDFNYTTYGMEEGYLFLNSLIKTLGFNFFGFTLIHSIVFYTLLFSNVKKYTNKIGIVLVIFLYKLFFYNTFISLRQSLTIAIFWYLIKYINEKQLIKYFIGCFICMKIHTASIVLFPIYFINKIKITKKLIIRLNIIFIPCILIDMVGINIYSFLEPILKYIQDPTVQSKVSGIVNNTGGGINLLHTLEYFIIMFLVIENYEKVIKYDSKDNIVIKLFLILLPIFTLFRGVEIITRIKDYFIITYGILLGYIFEVKCKKDILKFIIIIYYCGLTFLRFILLFDNGALMPYESYIFKGLSIFR